MVLLKVLLIEEGLHIVVYQVLRQLLRVPTGHIMQGLSLVSCMCLSFLGLSDFLVHVVQAKVL